MNAAMTDHVAVLREMRDYEQAMADDANIPAYYRDDARQTATALDHAIAAVAERDALVARLGGLEARWRNHIAMTCKTHTDYGEGCADSYGQCADDLARVVKENSDG